MVAPGCTKRLPLSGSTSPAAILSSVDLPDPLRPIRQTRSAVDTDNSTPDNSGVPPKVSAMSFNWISGGAMVQFQFWFEAGALTPWRWVRRVGWARAGREAERARGANDLWAPLTSPGERRSGIRLRPSRG